MKGLLIAVVLVLFVPLLAACKTGGTVNSSGGAVDINSLTAEIARNPAPAGVDARVYAMLADELAAQLRKLHLGAARIASAAPGGSAGLVADLEYHPSAGTLTWSYVNKGDYDLNGEVGVGDITPIAIHYMADANDFQGDDALESWIDGDGTGEVSIGDITPIALNYLGLVDHYDILTSATPAGALTQIGSVTFGARIATTVPPTFSVPVPAGALNYVTVQASDAGTNTGARPAGVDVTTTVEPPEVISVSPLTAPASSNQNFTASITGTAPFVYAWNFGVAAAPANSTDAAPAVVMTGFPGTYNASLHVSNSAGSDTFNFQIVVTGSGAAKLTKLFFQHHSTGAGFVFAGDMRGAVAAYNAANGTSFTFCDNGYNGEYYDETGTWQDINYLIPNDNTDVEGYYYLWTSQNADAVAARNMILDNHEVIAFKSCFPNSAISDDAMLAQYKTWYLAIRDFLDTRPDKLFIVMSTPPLHRLSTNQAEATRARAWANWLGSGEFLGAGHPNILYYNVFDHLAAPDDGGATANMLRSEYEGSPTDGDSHPNALANQTVGPNLATFMCSWAEVYEPPT